MLGTGWLTIRQAQEALKIGRLEEAQRLLGQSAALGHKRSWDLLQKLAVGFVRRGQRHLQQQDLEGAWNDLLLAEQVGLGDDSAGVHLRQDLTRLGLEEVRTLLAGGDPGCAMSAAELLRGRAARHTDLQALEAAARDWLSARELADRGEFSSALQIVERLRQQLPDVPPLEWLQQDLNRRREVYSPALGVLHEAVAACNWRKVVELADCVLAVAPQQVDARKARAQAWKAIEPPTIAGPQSPPKMNVTTPKAPQKCERFLLWIDGVGGYLVCLANRVTLGQATPDAVVDIALYADISRHHATVTRDSGSYIAEASRPMQVNAQQTEQAVLQPGDRVTLGSSCQLQFTQPVPVSASARLDLVSGHRLALAVDAVLLMADTIVLGPAGPVHVSLPDLSLNVVLYRTKEGLAVRYPGSFQLDGQRVEERGQLGANSRIVIDDCCFTVEMCGTKIG
jgi:hypothetical protein